jgi:Cu-Zn family superoxide dismutase
MAMEGEGDMRHNLIGAALALAAGGCAGTMSTEPRPGASVELRDAGGSRVAQAALSEDVGGVRIRLEAFGLPPGIHGIHVHAVGRCDPPDFASAGPHLNPAGRQHGRDNPQGMHQGDLPNLTIGADGRGHYDATIAGAFLSNGEHGLLGGAGTALVIHAQPDDYRTDPSGNSGPRIACGIIG